MTKFQQDILNLIVDGLQNKSSTYTDLDYASIFEFAKNQQLVGLLFYGLSFQEDFKASEVYKKFLNAFMNAFKLSENQLVEFKKLCDKFDEENITYLPLKGSVLKTIYPHPEMRIMGDMDIFIDLKDIDKINKIMLDFGYNFEQESDHELIWQKGKILIELHKRLIPSYNKDFYEYYGDGWGFIKDNKMSNEDTFVYLFTHLAKHYRDGGIGVKYFVDLYIYKKTYPNLDEAYITKQLDKLKLLEFYNNICMALSVWFDGAQTTEKVDFITNVVFNNGVYGDYVNSVLADGVKKSKSTKNIKAKKFFSLLFPSYKAMCSTYPFLKKGWILLPLMYIVRIVSRVFTKGKVKNALDVVKITDNKTVEEYQKSLNYVGLDYNFKG